MAASSYAAYDQILPPTSPSHAVSCHLTPPPASSSSYPTSRGILLSHLVTARDETLQVWEVRTSDVSSSERKLFHLRTKTLFGSITGLQSAKTIESESDAKDRLVVSFKDAKMALLEWDELNQDVATISVHTYERTAQLSAGLPGQFHPILALDPAHRCATLLLPKDSLAILPLTSSSDLDLLDDDEEFEDLYSTGARGSGQEQVMPPYTPSFVLPLSEVDEGLRNIRDVVFLPNFQRPTAAILCEPDTQSWTGSLSTRRDTLHLYVVTLDLSAANHTVLSHVPNLPYDTIYIQPSPSLGGVFVVTSTAIFHADQNGKLSGMRLNRWTERITTNEAILSMPEWKRPVGSRHLDLSNSHMVWTEGLPLANADTESTVPVRPAAGSGLLFLQDGAVLSLRCTLDGRSVASIHLELVVDCPLVGVESSLVLWTGQRRGLEGADAPLLLIGSMLGNSKLVYVSAKSVHEDGDVSTHQNGRQAAANGNKADMDVDLDDDADLYGDSALPSADANAPANGHLPSGLTRYILTEVDTLPGLGPISDISLAVVRNSHQEDIVKTVIAHGVDGSGGLTQLEMQIQPRMQQDLIYGGQQTSIWYIGDQSVIFDAGAEQESLVCRIQGDFGQMSQLGAIFGGILAAGRLEAEGHLFAVIRAGGLEVFDLSHLEDGPIQSFDVGKEIAQASVPTYSEEGTQFVGITTADGEVHVYRFSNSKSLLIKLDPARSRLDHVQMTLLFVDSVGATDLDRQQTTASIISQLPSTMPAPAANDEEVDYGEDEEEQMESATDASAPSVDRHSPLPMASSVHGLPRLAVVTVAGSLEIYSLPALDLIWRSNSLWDLPMRLDGLGQAEEVIVCSQGVQAARQSICISLIGDNIAVTMIGDDGLLTCWEAAQPSAVNSGDGAALPIQLLVFNKTFAKQLEMPSSEPYLQPPDGEVRPGATFRLLQRPGAIARDGPSLFVSGPQPGWISKTTKGGIQFAESSINGVDSLAWLKEDCYVISHIGGISAAELPHDLNYDLALPRSAVSTGRYYTHVRACPSIRALVVASAMETPFALFDTEDSEIIRSLEVDPSPAMSRRGAIELFKDDWSEPIDGFELEQNETVSALELLTLTSASTPTGLKEFVVVGTTIFNGEDRPTRGSTYIFDVIETVPNPDDPLANARLKLLLKEDARGPVTALSDISGYLVCATGQKLYIRAFENHEVLIHIAFLDTNYLTTSIRRLGSTLLLSDLKKSLTFVGFQEDPFKLTVFSRDFNDSYATTGNYLITGDSLAFVSTDISGSVRLLDYNPTLPSTQGGQRLVLRTEFQVSTEFTASTTMSGPTTSESGGLALSNQILLGGLNGSLSLIRPIKEQTFARLNPLQSTMTRHVQHSAGLNPRGFRIVRNEGSSRPLNKGILDGPLLRRFIQGVSRPKMEELVILAKGGAAAPAVATRMVQEEAEEEDKDEKENGDGAEQQQQQTQAAKAVRRVLSELRHVLR